MLSEYLVKDLYSLYYDLTESNSIKIEFKDDVIYIKIIAKWFNLQSPEERQEYLYEGLEVIFPKLAKQYTFVFIAMSPNEIN